MTNVDFKDSYSRHTLSFDEYSSQLIANLTEAGAPKVLLDGLKRIEETISENRVYTAPEALNDAQDKNILFDAFCEFEALASSRATSPRTGWQRVALKFFEDHQ